MTSACGKPCRMPAKGVCEGHGKDLGAPAKVSRPFPRAGLGMSIWVAPCKPPSLVVHQTIDVRGNWWSDLLV